MSDSPCKHLNFIHRATYSLEIIPSVVCPWCTLPSPPVKHETESFSPPERIGVKFVKDGVEERTNEEIAKDFIRKASDLGAYEEVHLKDDYAEPLYGDYLKLESELKSILDAKDRKTPTQEKHACQCENHQYMPFFNRIDELRAQNQRYREALNWVTHLINGVSKDGSSNISNEEWEECNKACQSALSDGKGGE